MSEKIRPLNAVLHRRLVATFQHVRIKNPGQAAVSGESFDPQKKKVVRRRVTPGEEYAVCCPMCNDTRFRLHIGHLYGTRESKDRNNENLAYCFNGGCPLNMRQPEAYRELYEMLTGSKLYDLGKAGVKPGKVVSKMPAGWPGEMIRVDKLPSNHKCVLYLEQERSFDVKVLAESYNVHYCNSSKFKVCEGKFVVPIYLKGRMVGWQARCCFDVDDWSSVFTPKYYTDPNFSKSATFYNIDEAQKCPTAVVMEGVTDVWRLGSPGLASLGASLSPRQMELLVKLFSDRPVIWLMDGDIWDPASKIPQSSRDKIVEQIATLHAKMHGNFISVRLPAKKDPGSYTSRSYLRGYIAYHAAAQGVTVKWR
jgi:hypothetical protein